MKQQQEGGGDFKTPRRVRKASFSGGGASGRVDKENTRSGVGVVGGGRGSKGNDDGSESRQKHLSGKKRGGDDIAKQQSFTGSYFQVTRLFVVVLRSSLVAKCYFWGREVSTSLSVTRDNKYLVVFVVLNLLSAVRLHHAKAFSAVDSGFCLGLPYPHVKGLLIAAYGPKSCLHRRARPLPFHVCTVRMGEISHPLHNCNTLSESILLLL